MLYYDRFDINEGTDPTKSNESRECMISSLFLYFFFNHGFIFQNYVCNGCHEFTMLSVNISNIAIITVKMLIIVVLFITLANQKQLIYYINFVLEDRGVYIKRYCLNFQSIF